MTSTSKTVGKFIQKWALGITILGLSFLAPRPARAEFGFSAPTYLTPGLQESNADILDETVAADDSGRFIAVFSHGLTGFRTLQFSVYENGAWQTERALPVHPEKRYGREPSIAADAQGNWVVIWSAAANSGEETDIVAARSDDNGQTWAGPFIVNSGAADDGDAYDIQPILKTDRAGRWIAIWRHNAFGGELGNDDDLLYAISIDNGQTWSPQAPLNKTAPGDTGFDIEPRMAIDTQGNWMVLWQSNDGLGGVLGADVDILYSRSTDSGATWSSPLPFNPTAGSDAVDDIHPEIAVSPEGVWLAMWRDDSVDHLMRSTDGGATWIELPNQPFGNLPVLLPIGGGKWFRSVGAFFGVSDNDGGTWANSTVPAVFYLPSFNSQPAIAQSQGQVMHLVLIKEGPGGNTFKLRYRIMPQWPIALAASQGFTPISVRLDSPGFEFRLRVTNQGTSTWGAGQVSVIVSDPCGLLINPQVLTVTQDIGPGSLQELTYQASVPPVVGVCDLTFNLQDATAGVFATFTNSISFFGYAAVFVSTNTPDVVLLSQNFVQEIVLRNTGELTWTPSTVDLDVVTDSCNLTGSVRPTLTANVGPGQNGTFTVPLRAPAQATQCSLVYQPRFKLEQSEHIEYGHFGNPITIPVNVSGDSAIFNLQNNQASWTGASILGDGIVGSSPTGVCMYAPDQGENMLAWISDSGAFPLVDLRVARLRIAATSSQTLTDAIPLWDVTYDNFYPSGFGSTYGGEAWFLDVAGGANGVSRPQGRTSFDVYAAPNAMLTPQWRGTLGSGPVGSNGGAFSPEADPYNDMRLAVRILDFGSAGVNANLDFGTICVSQIRVDSLTYDSLAPVGTLWAPPMSASLLAAQTLAQEAEGAGVATIIEGVRAEYQLTASGPGSRKTLIPLDASLSGLPSLYPIAWESDRVYRGVSFIQSMVGGGAGPEGSDPVDTVFLNFDTPTNELGFISYTTRGSFNNMDLAASPRLAATAGGAQPYVAFFSGNNRTLSDIPDAARLRLMTEFFNIPEIAPAGSGADPLAVVGTAVDHVQPPI